MSVITTRSSTVLSILKTKDSRSSLNRVRFKVPSNVRKIFLDQKKGVNCKDYEDLVCTIRDSEICDEDLLSLLSEAKNCISLLSYDLRLFVQALIIIGWTYRSDNVVSSYQEFFSGLVSAHPQHAKTVLNQLVKLFNNGDEKEWDEEFRPSPLQQREFNNVHHIIKKIIRTIPMSEELLISCVVRNFPYFRMPATKQLCYFYNTLSVISYMPQSRREILQVVIDKLIALDVNISRDEIVGTVDDIMFPMDDTTMVPNALDKGMMLLFGFIDNVCRPNGELKWMEAKNLLADLLEIFDKSMLTVHGCEHVHFCLFYLTSFKTTLAQTFLHALWKKILTPGLAPVVRKLAVAYLSSYLARASFITLGFLKTYLSEMTTWVHKYIAALDPNVPVLPIISIHGVFYAVCQAIFYLIAFRHKDLVDSRKKLSFLQCLNLSKIVTCPLNPLQMCSTDVVENFASVAKDYQLAYCYTVIEENARQFTHPVTLDALFPFDPYLLPKSSKYILPIYLDYNGDTKPLEDSDSMKTDGETTNNDEDDDFIKELERNRSHHTGMDISYSTSPGFKPMSL